MNIECSAICAILLIRRAANRCEQLSFLRSRKTSKCSFWSYYDKVIARNVIGSTGMDSDESLDAIIEHTQNQIVDYMSIRGGIVSKPEVMFVFGESEITRDAIDGLIDDEKIAVVNGEFTTIGYYFPKA